MADVSWRSPDFAASEPPATDALQDAARVAEVALETAMRAAERAKASRDPAKAVEARRVVERLRALLEDGTGTGR